MLSIAPHPNTFKLELVPYKIWAHQCNYFNKGNDALSHLLHRFLLFHNRLDVPRSTTRSQTPYKLFAINFLRPKYSFLAAFELVNE